jgi:nanoRNase/pAp phosphatase (c-di-AMP/oligoRNAs hydrolase)
MSLTIEKQIKEFLDNSNNVLLVVPEEYSGDCLCCALAFYNFLLQSKKPVSIDLILPQKPKKIYSFLPKIDDAIVEFDKIKRLVFDINTQNAKVKEIDYTEEGGRLKIFLTSSPYEIKPNDITVYYKDFYDLIIIFNSPDLQSLGDIFYKNAEFFHKTPIINIDFNPANEKYGQINFIDAKFGSVSEQIFDFFNVTDSYISKEIADCIFSGLVFTTKGFTNNRVTPNCLSIASKLIQLGAEREKIISNIYQNKSITLLKIWGQILSQMKYDENSKMAWSFVDVETVDVDNVGVKELIEEIISRSPQVEIIVLFHKITEDTIRVYVYSNNKHSSFKLVSGLAEKREISGDDDLLCFEFRGINEDSYINILETVKRNINKIVNC